MRGSSLSTHGLFWIMRACNMAGVDSDLVVRVVMDWDKHLQKVLLCRVDGWLWSALGIRFKSDLGYTLHNNLAEHASASTCKQH